MKRELVQRISKLARERMTCEFPDVPEHKLGKEEKRLFVSSAALVFRKNLGEKRWGLICFQADPRDADRLLVAVGWSYVDPLAYVKAGSDRLPIRTKSGAYPNTAAAWGMDSVEILAGGSTGLGWKLDIAPERFDASCEKALDEVMEMLHAVVPQFFGRIAQSTGNGLAEH